MFGDGVPDPDLPGVAGGDQLVTDEEESLHWHVQAEDTWRENPDGGDCVRRNLPESSSSLSATNRNAPISFPLPSGQMAQRMISVAEATATILSLSPSEPAITLALSATLSMTQSRRGDVKTCCHPVDSFTLTGTHQINIRSITTAERLIGAFRCSCGTSDL